MRHRIFWLFLLCVLLAGCQADWLSSLQAVNKQTETQKEEEKKKKEEEAIRQEKKKWKKYVNEQEENAQKLQFGDFDPNVKGSLTNPREAFDTDENISFKLTSPSPFGTNKLTVNLLQLKGEVKKVIRRYEVYLSPDYVWYTKEFYRPAIDGKLEPGEYKVRIYKDLTLIGVGTFHVVDGLSKSNRLKDIELPGSVGITLRENWIKLNVPEPILFEFGKSSLTDEAKTTLNEVARFLNHFPNSKVQIEGHTDSIGSAAYNQKLSEERAEVVKEHLEKLTQQGIRFQTKGWGETKPIASNDTVEGRQKNRRVEIIVTPEQ
jgi:outer membrane protein OmpA-like peptidoglycan-associated protein